MFLVAVSFVAFQNQYLSFPHSFAFLAHRRRERNSSQNDQHVVISIASENVEFVVRGKMNEVNAVDL